MRTRLPRRLESALVLRQPTLQLIQPGRRGCLRPLRLRVALEITDTVDYPVYDPNPKKKKKKRR